MFDGDQLNRIHILTLDLLAIEPTHPCQELAVVLDGGLGFVFLVLFELNVVSAYLAARGSPVQVAVPALSAVAAVLLLLPHLPEVFELHNCVSFRPSVFVA